MDIIQVGYIISLLVSMAAIVISVLRFKREGRNINADTIESYESILKMATERATREANRAEKAVTELQVWKERVEVLETRMKGLEQENLLYRGWSERLCHQLSSLGAAPVPLIPKEEKKKS